MNVEEEERKKLQNLEKEEKEEEIKTDFTWFKNARIYQIFIDRYAGIKENYNEEELKTSFLYGNIKALLNKLDYIASMNFNVIWLSPFFCNQPNGYHGYHPINFNHVDPRFAYGEHPIDNETGNPFDPQDFDLITSSDKMLIEFIQKCHEKNFKVMMDLVPNHVHETHPFFIDAKNNKESKYRKWFYFVEDMTEEEKKELFPTDEQLNPPEPEPQNSEEKDKNQPIPQAEESKEENKSNENPNVENPPPEVNEGINDQKKKNHYLQRNIIVYHT